jgi:hypothetical protein
MAAGGQGRSSSSSKRSADRALTSAGDRPQRRGFSQPGRTKIDRNRDLPVERQIRALLKNPTPSPAEQNRLCELTRTKSYRAAVGVAKRMLVPPRPDDVPVAEEPPRDGRRNSR